MALFVKREDVVLDRAAIAKRGCHWTMVPSQNTALWVKMRKRVAALLSHHLMCQVARDLLRAPVPEAHPLLPIQNINTNRQVLEHRSIECRIFEERRHDWPLRLWAKSQETSG